MNKILFAFVNIVADVMGWFSWLVVIYSMTMVVDYITGTAVAIRQGNWNSKIARIGIWKKVGSLVAVMVSICLDFLVYLVTEYIAVLALPFDYKMFLSPIVLAWYIIIELGSIIENAGAMGAPIPLFLKRWISSLNESIEQTGDMSDRKEK